jgi:hypothetical protein
MAKRADTSKWKVNKLDEYRLEVTVPADDILGKRREDGKRPYKMPMRKIVAKLKTVVPGNRWDYSGGKFNEDGKTCTFMFVR